MKKEDKNPLCSSSELPLERLTVETWFSMPKRGEPISDQLVYIAEHIAV